MSFAIPKQLTALNSLVTPTVIPVELNDTDVDRMLTRILEMAVKRGRTASSRVDTRDYERYLEAIQQSPHLVGFDGDRGRDVLDGWIRSSILKEERRGLRRDSVQMGYLRPLTIAAYRTGLPKTASRNRRSDALTYQSMERILTARGSANPSAEIEKLFLDTFGRGVDLGTAPWDSPRYDGSTELDIDTLLALRFIEGFTGSQKLSRERVRLDPPVPQAIDPLGQDLLTFLELYGPNLPVSEAYAHISALLSLRLFQLPLVTAYAVRAMLSGQETPHGSNPTQMYCDFVRRRGSASDELSRVCVARDLEIMRTFFGDRLLLRSLGQAVSMLPTPPELGESAEEELRSLASLQSDQAMQMALLMQIQSIHTELGDDTDGREFIDDVRKSPGLSPADQLTAILVEGLRKRGLENQVKWFYNTGGITKPYGLLAGTLRARSTWRYSPSDEALTTLLSMCFVEPDGKRTVRRLPIRNVLERLEQRFGILIDRPPAELDSADARAGAAENLAAFTRQLKLLGCFQGLSDDFTAQFVTQPREAVK
jgi:hypothetical protein